MNAKISDDGGRFAFQKFVRRRLRDGFGGMIGFPPGAIYPCEKMDDHLPIMWDLSNRRTAHCRTRATDSLGIISAAINGLPTDSATALLSEGFPRGAVAGLESVRKDIDQRGSNALLRPDCLGQWKNRDIEVIAVNAGKREVCQHSGLARFHAGNNDLQAAPVKQHHP